MTSTFLGRNGFDLLRLHRSRNRDPALLCIITCWLCEICDPSDLPIDSQNRCAAIRNRYFPVSRICRRNGPRSIHLCRCPRPRTIDLFDRLLPRADYDTISSCRIAFGLISSYNHLCEATRAVVHEMAQLRPRHQVMNGQDSRFTDRIDASPARHFGLSFEWSGDLPPFLSAAVHACLPSGICDHPSAAAQRASCNVQDQCPSSSL